MQKSEIKVNYFDLTSHACMQAVVKIANSSDYVSGKAAYEVKKLYSEFKKAKKKIQDHYEKEIVEKFVKRDEKGEKVAENPDQMNPEGFNVDMDRFKEFEEAKAAFGKNEVILECRPLTLDGINGVKGISPADMDALGALLTEQ